jgi:type IV pilus assembly protein PilW
VTIEHNTTSSDNYYAILGTVPTMNAGVPGVSYTTAEIYNLGSGAQLTQWQVSAGVLTRTNVLRGSTSAEVTEGVVNLQAEYGVDANSNGRIEAGEWTNTAPILWSRVLAVRVAVLARSSQFERENVTPAAPAWAGGAFVMQNLDASGTDAGDWHHYRYRVYETVVPLRNMIWGATS